MEKFEEFDLLVDILDSNNIKCKPNRTKNRIATELVTISLNDTALEQDEKVQRQGSFFNLLSNLAKIYPLKNIEKTLNNVNWFNSFVKKYTVQEYNVTMLNASKTNPVFYLAPEEENGTFFQTLFKIENAKNKLIAVIDNTKFTINKNGKNFNFETTTDNSSRFHFNNFLDDDSLSSCKIIKAPEILLYKNGTLVDRKTNIKELLCDDFFEAYLWKQW